MPHPQLLRQGGELRIVRAELPGAGDGADCVGRIGHSLCLGALQVGDPIVGRALDGLVDRVQRQLPVAVCDRDVSLGLQRAAAPRVEIGGVVEIPVRA